MRNELSTSARHLGVFRASAANESGREVLASVYAVAVAGVAVPRAEIAVVGPARSAAGGGRTAHAGPYSWPALSR